MKHFSEHILELFIRNSSEVEPEREAISHHVETCAGCRELVEEIKEFYSLAEESKKLLSEHSSESSSLMMEPHIGRPNITGSYVPNSLPARMIRYVRQQPVKSSLFTFGFILFGVFSINSILKKNESNPSYFEYNVNNNSIVVFDKKDTKIWEKRVKEDVAGVNTIATSSLIYRTLIVDVDHDEKKEIASILSLASDEDQSKRLRIFDGIGEIKNTYSIPFHSIQFNSKQYQTDFFPTSMVFGGTVTQTLFVSNNNGRSPCVIIRYNEKGNVLGTYWHFGQVVTMFYDVDNDGKNELILNGIDDTDDEVGRSYATTIILDPDKLIGDGECSATKGFGFPSSNAELYCIRYPNPGIMQYSDNNLGAVNSAGASDKFFRVLNQTQFNRFTVAIEYFFDTTFTVNDVKFDSGMLNKHKQFLKEGKLKQPINEQFIKSLKEAVLYWNGTQWVNKPTRINGQLSLK